VKTLAFVIVAVLLAAEAVLIALAFRGREDT
jgi:hypothetical protein